MKIIIRNSYKNMSRQAADDLIELLKSSERPLICPASGDTTTGLYKELVNDHDHKKFDVSKCLFVSLDEWVGMNGNDPGSCRNYLDIQLFKPLNLKEKQVCFFDGKADLDMECHRIEKFITEHGRIYVSVLGLGMNGHIGLNEPGTSPLLRSHVTDIDTITQKVAQKYFSKEQQLSEGITLGLATIMESAHLFLLVGGKHKAAIVKQLVEGDITPELPGSLLRNHPGLRIYLDAEAAAMVENKSQSGTGF